MLAISRQRRRLASQERSAIARARCSRRLQLHCQTRAGLTVQKKKEPDRSAASRSLSASLFPSLSPRRLCLSIFLLLQCIPVCRASFAKKRISRMEYLVENVFAILHKLITI